MSKSPVPKKSKKVVIAEVVGMTFPDAMQSIINGERVRRDEWPDGIHGVLKDGFLMLKKEDGFHQWLVSEGDMDGRDWLTV